MTDGEPTPAGRPRGLPRRVFDEFEEIVCAAALVAVVLAVSWGVLTRYVTEQPAPWSGEVAAIAFAWLIFLGASAGFKRGMHVSIDALVRLLPGAIRRPLAALVDLLVLAFCVYVTWLAIGFTVRTWDNPTSVLRLPQSITYAAPAVGFAFMALRYGALAWGRWRGRPVVGEA